MIIITDRMYHSAIEIASKAPEDMHKLSERIVKRTCRGRFRYLNLHQFLEVENDKNRINCDYPPLSPLLWLNILVETTKNCIKLGTKFIAPMLQTKKTVILQTYHLTAKQVDWPVLVVITL